MVIVDLISELLYSNNCVIVPNFGGFVGNVKSTEVNHTRGRITPARKRIAFNRSLQENDGMLIQALVKRSAISYEEAEKQVRQFVAHLNDRLKRFKNVELKQVGSLYLNKEDKLIFVPYDGMTFLKPSFGLSELRLRKVAVQAAPEVVETPVVPIKRRQNLFIPQIAAAVAIFCIFGVMMWQLLRSSAYNDIAHDQTPTSVEESIASILPEASELNTTTTEDAPNTEEAPSEVNQETFPVHDDYTESMEVEEVPNFQADDASAETTEVPNVSNAIDLLRLETIYYIAVAKNYDTDQGRKLRKKMERKDYSVTEMQISEDTVMVIEKFYSEQNASDFLQLVKQYDYKSAFIYTNQE